MVKCGKPYKIFKLVRGTTKNGFNYAIFKIKESVKDETATATGGWKQYYYKVFVGDTCDDAVEGGNVTFNEIDGVQIRTTMFGGKETTECTIYPTKGKVSFDGADGATSGETVNANPWRADDLPF